MKHLTIRTAWHDSLWDGTICRHASGNGYCVALDEIRESRDDAAEDALAGRSWATLTPDQLPPCHSESGAFMSPVEWKRVFEHPYRGITKANATHGHLKRTPVTVRPFSTFGMPFAWMLRENQHTIDESLADPLPFDQDPPFNSAWVFGRERQLALSRLFFDQVTERTSLVFFYTKQGQPLGGDIRLSSRRNRRCRQGRQVARVRR